MHIILLSKFSAVIFLITPFSHFPPVSKLHAVLSVHHSGESNHWRGTGRDAGGRKLSCLHCWGKMDAFFCSTFLCVLIPLVSSRLCFCLCLFLYLPPARRSWTLRSTSRLWMRSRLVTKTSWGWKAALKSSMICLLISPCWSRTRYKHSTRCRIQFAVLNVQKYKNNRF